ncbi:MAG TPA: tripartite tricarboxylate transporter substrate binding protein, partial [Ramlibacter sp.]|nr:tripartite tricarboxylate transporter substrate binding protein [Ramlibacter sp.]
QGSFNHIAYKGSIPGLMDLVGGQIDLMHDNALTSGPFVKSGKLRALAVRAHQRMAQFPDVPTMADAGLGKINHVLWFGVVVKAGTPAAVVQRISDEVLAAMRHPDVAKKFTDLGLDISMLGPQEFNQFLAAEYDKWGGIIRDTRIRLEE